MQLRKVWCLLFQKILEYDSICYFFRWTVEKACYRPQQISMQKLWDLRWKGNLYDSSRQSTLLPFDLRVTAWPRRFSSSWHVLQWKIICFCCQLFRLGQAHYKVELNSIIEIKFACYFVDDVDLIAVTMWTRIKPVTSALDITYLLRLSFVWLECH